jgi:hypothetical protein
MEFKQGMKIKHRIIQLCLLATATLLLAGCPADDSADAANAAGLTLEITNPAGATEIQTPDIVVNLSGTAAGNADIESVQWQNDRGGKGNANGKEAWVTGNIVLQLGTNNITITAVDINGASTSKTLTVERENTAPGAADSQPTNPAELMYSYQSNLSNGAPVKNASILNKTVYFYVIPASSWVAKGIRDIKVSCCLGVSGPGAGNGYGINKTATTSPWSNAFNISGMESGGTRRARIQATFTDGSTSERVTFDFVVAAAKSDTNTAPLISGSPQKSATAGIQYSFRPAAEDPDGDTMQFNISGKPDWATFNKTNGRLYGTPTANHVGRHANIVISVSDGKTSSSLPAFAIDVEAIGGGNATLTWSIPTRRTDNSVLNNLAGFYIYYGQTQGDYANKIKIANPTVSNYMVDNLSGGRWYFVVTAYDGGGLESNPSNEGSKQF